MSARPAYDRDSYLEDIKALRGRGWSHAAIASELGMSRATVFRILQEGRRR